jgi:hypothetical protein
MKRYWVPLMLLVLAACTQVAPTPGAQADLAPLSFGSSGFDSANALAKHSSGVYVGGETNGNLHGTSKGNYDAFIRKYDTFGAVVWGRQFGTTQYEFVAGVASDSSNNAYVVGTTNGSLAGSRGSNDIFLRKYNASGGVVWTRQFGGAGYDSGNDVAVIGSNVYVVGKMGNASTGGDDVYLAKYNSSGGVVWTRTFGTTGPDVGYDVAVDGSGNAYVVGTTYGALGGVDGNGADMFIRRYNANGSAAWTKQFDYSNDDHGEAIAFGGGHLYVVGRYYANAASSSDVNVRVIKLNTSGGVVYNFGHGTTLGQYVSDVSVNGGLYFSGHEFNGRDFDGFVSKYTTSGSFVWAAYQNTPSNDLTNAVLARTSSEVYATGSTYGVLGGGNSGSTDAFLRRLNASSLSTVWTDQ